MGYTSAEISILLRLERHNGPGDKADNEAADNLAMEIEALIASTPEYERIALAGVSGPGY